MSEIKPECRNLANGIAMAIVNSERVLDSLRIGDEGTAELLARDMKRDIDKVIPFLDLPEREFTALRKDSESIVKTVPFYTDPTPKSIVKIEGEVRSVQSILLSAGLTQVAACQCNPCK